MCDEVFVSGAPFRCALPVLLPGHLLLKSFILTLVFLHLLASPGVARVASVSDIPAGDGKIDNLFYSVLLAFSFLLSTCMGNPYCCCSFCCCFVSTINLLAFLYSLLILITVSGVHAVVGVSDIAGVP